MPAHPSHKRRLTRCLGWRLFGILSVTLQSGTLGWIATRRAILRREKLRGFTGELVGLQISVQRFTIETDLALVALASSDWPILVEHRLESQQVRERIQKKLLSISARSQDGPPGQFQDLLGQLSREWSKLDRAATLALRYDPDELRGNPRLLEVDQASRRLLERLEKMYTLLGEEAERRLAKLELLQIFSLGLNFIVVLSAMVYSSRRFIQPLVQAFDDLESTRKKLLSQQAALVQSAKLAALGEMAAGLAHEIYNPLCAIKSQAEVMGVLASKERLTLKRSLEAFRAIDRIVDRIAVIVKGLRNIARSEEDLPYFETLLRSVVEDVLSVCRQRFLQAGIELRVGPVPSSLKLECRSGQISHILLNLLSNAYDAVLELSEKWIQIDTVDRGQEVEISVSDSGSGIPAPIAEKIMQPFFTTKEVGRGTGIGLSIAQAIVQDHHGSLDLDVTSRNTRFVLRLPKKQPLPRLTQSA